jgi:hypothetical protein
VVRSVITEAHRNSASGRGDTGETPPFTEGSGSLGKGRRGNRCGPNVAAVSRWPWQSCSKSVSIAERSSG